MRVLLAPHGTRGDVQPMIALAIGLRARGHHVSFVAPDNFVAWIRAHGFDVQGDGIDVEAMLRAEGARFDSLRWQMRHISQLLIPRLFASLSRATEVGTLQGEHDICALGNSVQQIIPQSGNLYRIDHRHLKGRDPQPRTTRVRR